MSFICGSFRSQEDDYDVLWRFPSTSPRKPTRKRNALSSRRGKNPPTNPYSDRGLDKFEALLADLDKQRQKTLTQKGSENVSMVKFVYKGPNEFQPIIVKLRDQRKQDNILDHQNEVAFNELKEDNTKPSVDHHEPAEKIRFDQRIKRKFVEWLKPSYYLPLFIILILVFLMFSGRSFAILCTSIGWYLVPIINKVIRDSKHPNGIKKNEYINEKTPRRTHKE